MCARFVTVHRDGAGPFSRPTAIYGIALALVVGCIAPTHEHASPAPASAQPAKRAVLASNLGARCSEDAECGAGLMCLTATSGRLDRDGSPAGGICTAPCELGGDTCRRLSPGAVCGYSETSDYSKGFCFEGCVQGHAGRAAHKCHARFEVACESDPNLEDIGGRCTKAADCPSTGFMSCIHGLCVRSDPGCLPQCNRNEECAKGLFCDFRSDYGLCRPAPTTGLPTGAPCSAGVVCRGMCESQGHDTEGVCVDACTTGAPLTCGWNGTGRAEAACLGYPPIAAEPEAGNAAACTQLCDCNSDCASKALVCNEFPDGVPAFQRYQRRGYCDKPPIAKAGAGIPCTDSTSLRSRETNGSPH